MIDEKILLEKLNMELDKAKARFDECEDFDCFYAAVCSSLETTIKLVEKQPKIEPKEMVNSMYGRFGNQQYIDTDMVCGGGAK